MSQTHEDSDQCGEVRKVYPIEPAHGVGTELQVLGRREGRKSRMSQEDRVKAPADQDDDHDGGDLHDAHGLLAGLVDALDVVPPEVNGAENGKKRGTEIRLDVKAPVDVVGGFVEQSDNVLAGGHATDGSGEDIVEHQRRDAEFRERAAQGFLDDAVDATAHKHAAAFDVNRADRVGKQHDAQDEPRSGLADVALGFATGIIGGGSQVIEYDGCSAPEGNEAQQSRGRD